MNKEKIRGAGTVVVAKAEFGPGSTGASLRCRRLACFAFPNRYTPCGELNWVQGEERVRDVTMLPNSVSFRLLELSECYRIWYHSDMSQYERIYQRAIDNYGVVTADDAHRLGVHRKEMLNWTRMGRLVKCGRGVYRLTHYVPTELDRYAEALALVGGDAMVFGDGVLALHNLALVNPPYVTVACSRRLRRALPEWIRVVKIPEGERVDNFNGIATQSVAAAIRFCRGAVMSDRLRDAVAEAERNGLVDSHEAESLRRDLAQ